MASLRDRDAGRDAASYDDDRKNGRYSAGGDRAHWFPADRATSPDIARITAETNDLFDRLMAPKAPVVRRAA